MARRHDESTLEGCIHRCLRHLIDVRKRHSVFSGSDMQVIDTGTDHVLGYVRQHNGDRALVLANFSEHEQTVPGNLLRLYGLAYAFTNLVTGQTVQADDLLMEPYAFVCLSS
jgi:amylosucrase